MAGKVWMSKSDNFKQGLQAFEVSNDEIKVGVVYYYKITSGEYSAIKKMIYIK